MIWHLLQKCCLLEKSRKFLVKLIWRKFSKILAKIAKFWGKNSAIFNENFEITKVESGAKECIV